eukprot:comp12143_c0_seq1/m.6888 comp12143_c0_seq1/g.6888  ORF comp12143_c0_seq1/g.6888 comp12143_c0_seq1/m.6888 type:complete len:424 (-) comp12143_c0_seq1:124-1395(-)
MAETSRSSALAAALLRTQSTTLPSQSSGTSSDTTRANAIAAALARRQTRAGGALLSAQRTRGDAGLAERPAVIIDMGRAFTKCGFSGEPVPRHIVKTPHLDHSCSREKLDAAIKGHLHNVYFKLLLVNPPERRVVCSEDYAMPEIIRDSLAHVLFHVLKAPSVINLPSPALPLFPLACKTALVIDCGYSELRVVPVCCGAPVVSAWRSAPLAGSAIDAALRKHMLASAVVERREQTRSVTEDDLCDRVLEEVKMHLCFIPPTRITEDSPDVPAGRLRLGNGETLVVSGETREQIVASLLFESGEEDGNTIQALVCEALLAAPIDNRKDLCENMVFCGGTVLMKGFRARAFKEIQERVQGLKAVQKLGEGCVVSAKRPAKYSTPPDCRIWYGAAVVGALDLALFARSTSAEAFEANRKLPSAFR